MRREFAPARLSAQRGPPVVSELPKRVGDPGRIRTCDFQLRRLALYPAELLGHANGGAYWTRTSDLRGVNTALYQLS